MALVAAIDLPPCAVCGDAVRDAVTLRCIWCATPPADVLARAIAAYERPPETQRYYPRYGTTA